MLKQRVISALIIATIIVSVIFLLPQNFLIYFLTAITCLSFWEFHKVRFSNLLTLFALFVFILLLFITQFSFFNNLFLILSVLVYLSSSIFMLSFPLNKNFIKNGITWSLVGFLVHLGFYAAILQILSADHSASFSSGPLNDRMFILFIVLISVLMDSLAFFAGKTFGVRPFITNVSPNKTLEGFLFAILISPVLLMLLSSSVFGLSLITLFILLFCVCLMSVIGDGFASMMKRAIGVKDYSNLIPGHGGIFDRLDSHMAAFPFFILFLNLII